MHLELHFHPYKMMVIQELTLCDWEQDQVSIEMKLEMMTENIVIMSDEVHFELLGFVNKQNSCYWSEANPRQIQKCPFHAHNV